MIEIQSNGILYSTFAHSDKDLEHKLGRPTRPDYGKDHSLTPRLNISCIFPSYHHNSGVQPYRMARMLQKAARGLAQSCNG